MFIIYDKNMKIIEFPEGVTPLDIFISSIGKERVTDRIEGSNEEINFGSTYTGRDVELHISMRANDTQDYRLLRDEVYAMFDLGDELYVSESYQPGKRYLISVDERYIPERLNQRVATAKIQCTKIGLPFAESTLTSMDIDKNGLRYGDGWSYGMGLLYDEESQKYSHNSTSFRIHNPSDITVHPFEQEMKITLTGITGKGFEMKNRTTGDTFKINDTMKPADTFIIDGANMTYNNVQGLRKTNKNYIRLAKGWNDIRLSSSAKVEFDFKFYYL